MNGGWWISAAASLSLLLGYQYRKRLGGGAAFTSFALIIAIFGMIPILRMVRMGYYRPVEWDFLAFWSYAQVGASGLDFYKVESFAQLLFPRPPSMDFTNEVLKVGFLYPPTTMLMLLPLGWLGMEPGFLLWYGVQFLALAIATVMLWRIFMKRSDLPGLALIFALVAWFPPMRYSFGCAQTNLLTLCAFLAFWIYRDSFKGGAALALGLMVKPYFAILLLFPFFTRRWRAIGGFALVNMGLCVLALAVFGWRIFYSYFTEMPASRLPLAIFSEEVNQSLPAFLIRSGFGHSGSPITAPANLALSGLLTVLTLWANYRGLSAKGNPGDKTHPDPDSDWALALTLMLALIVYPGSLVHYSVMALPAIFLLWDRRASIPGGPLAVGVLVSGVFGCAAASFTLGGHLLLWAALFWQTSGFSWSRPKAI